MELGAGVDIIAISRMSQILEGSGRDAFMKKVYTEAEIARARSHPQPVAYFAKTFAAKEAVFKTFSIAGTPDVRLTDIEIQDGQVGEPVAVLSGYFAGLAAQRKVSRVLLSMSYDGDYAIAMAVLAGGE
ncbi:MAG TPA: holo-ACP synthase [Terriglobales bacterium]